MRRGPDAVKLELWRRRLREFERGAETVAAFCRRVGVSAATFYGWRRKVAQSPGSDQASHGTPNRSGISVPPLSFLPVQVTGQPQGVIEVMLAGGVRVLVPSGDRESLRLVLELVSGAGEQPSC
jgi:transposase-like protein